jgi:hypothetical protein
VEIHRFMISLSATSAQISHTCWKGVRGGEDDDVGPEGGDGGVGADCGVDGGRIGDDSGVGDDTGDGGQRGDSGDGTGLDSSDCGGDYGGDVGVGDACKGVPRGERTWRVSSSLSFLFGGQPRSYTYILYAEVKVCGKLTF